MIAYAHNNSEHFPPRCTFAIKLPKKKILEAMAENKVPGLFLPLGIAFTHPKDSYVKAVGREQATNKITSKMVFSHSVNTREKRTIYEFMCDIKSPLHEAKEYTAILAFSTVPNSDNVHLEYAYLQVGIDYFERKE